MSVATTSPRSFAAVRSRDIMRLRMPRRRWVGLTPTLVMASAGTEVPPTAVSCWGKERKVATQGWGAVGSKAARVRVGSMWVARSARAGGLASGEVGSVARRKTLFWVWSQVGISGVVRGRMSRGWVSEGDVGVAVGVGVGVGVVMRSR